MELTEKNFAAGNTNGQQLYGKARSWFITDWNVEHYDINDDKLVYCIKCRDTSKSGQEHLHFVLYYKNPVSFNRIKSLLPGAHIEKPWNVNDAINYIKMNKKGRKYDIVETGIQPSDARFKKVSDLRDKPLDDVPIQYYNIKRKFDEDELSRETFDNMLREIEEEDLKAPNIYYFTGGSGKGKTYMAYKCALKMYERDEIGKITITNNFFDIINPRAKCFVIEEFRPSQLHAANFLQLTDKYGYRANTKGGFCTLRPECLFICSIVKPNELYTNEEITEQFLRRITLTYDFDEDDDAIN